MTESTNVDPRSVRWKLPLLVTLTAVLISLVAFHVYWINGPWYWKWPWRELSTADSMRWYGAMLIASLPILLAMALPRNHRTVSIALLMLGVFAIKVTSLAILTRPVSFDVMTWIVRDPSATSYYTDAAGLAEEPDWLALYPQILPHTNLHTQSKPPGAVAFFRFLIQLFGYGERSAIVSGIVLATLATASIPATYWLVRVLVGNSSSAITAAIMLALCPGFTIIFPTFDAVWPALACALIIMWHLAIGRNDWRFALGFGVVLGVSCFATYNLLVLGAFLAAWGVLARRNAVRSVVRLAAVAGSSLAAFYFLLWLVTGFDPIATFLSAWRNQHALLAQHRADRPYPWTILFDLIDFALGAGWLAVVLAGMRLARRPRSRLLILCVAQPLLVAILGILQSETARAWNFMLPLLLIPASIELSRWPARARTVVFGCMLVILLVVGRHMRFMGP